MKQEEKFKVGDIVKDPFNDVYHIVEIEDDSYRTDNGRFILFKNEDAYSLVEQKPVEWSEEDTIHRDWILECLADGKRKVPEYAEQYQSAFNWLKSLKDRIQLQQQKKSEWNEEDENRFNNLIFLVECSDENEPTKKGFIDFINRLKSTCHQRYWKPSDEQIRAFEWAYKSSKIEEGSQYDIDCKDLLEQLKAL